MNESSFIDENVSASSGQISERSKGFLAEIGKWTRFMSIVGFVGIGLIVLVAIILFVAGGAMSSLSNGPFSRGAAGGPVFIGVLYLIMAGIYIAPVIYMFNFSNHIRNAVKSNDSLVYDKAFEELKKHFKYVGIFTIVILSFYVLVILLGILGAVMS